MLGVAEHRRAELGVVAAHAVEHAGAVVQAVREDVDLGVLPGDEFSIHPDELGGLHVHQLLIRGFRALPRSPAPCPPRHRDRACAAPLRAHLQRPILQPPPRFPSRVHGGASSPPTGTSPADWRHPARRCPERSRGPARTGPGRRLPARRWGASRSSRSASRPRRRGCPRTCSRSRSCRSAAARRRAAWRRCRRACARA